MKITAYIEKTENGYAFCLNGPDTPSYTTCDEIDSLFEVLLELFEDGQNGEVDIHRFS